MNDEALKLAKASLTFVHSVGSIKGNAVLLTLPRPPAITRARERCASAYTLDSNVQDESQYTPTPFSTSARTKCMFLTPFGPREEKILGLGTTDCACVHLAWDLGPTRGDVP